MGIINSTLGKALGGASGGYTTGSKELISLLRQRSRPYSFSNSLPPPVVATASKVFDMASGKVTGFSLQSFFFSQLMSDNSLVEKISENTMRFRRSMTAAGFTIAGEDHPTSPVMLMEEGIFVIGLSSPVVARGKARIRVQISAAHSTEEIDRTVEAFVKIGRQLGVVN